MALLSLLPLAVIAQPMAQDTGAPNSANTPPSGEAQESGNEHDEAKHNEDEHNESVG